MNGGGEEEDKLKLVRFESFTANKCAKIFLRDQPC
jgi:hypothetical protein